VRGPAGVALPARWRGDDSRWEDLMIFICTHASIQPGASRLLPGETRGSESNSKIG